MQGARFLAQKWQNGANPCYRTCTSHDCNMIVVENWERSACGGRLGVGTDRHWQTYIARAAACKYFVSLPDRPAVFWKFIRPLAPFVTSKFNLLYFVCFLREANKKRKNWKKNKLKMNIIMNSFLSNLRGNLAIWNLPKILARMLASTNKSSDSNRTS